MKPLRNLALAALLAAPSAARAAEFFVDPASGLPTNDGSAEHPWRTLQEVVEGKLIETRHWESLPYAEGKALKTVNAGAPVKAGDTIWLRSGYHGEVAIQGAYNAEPITIAAAPGQTQQLRRLALTAAARWTIRGLSLSPSYAAAFAKTTILSVDSHNWHGPAHDVVIEDCELFSVPDTSTWTLDDWNTLSCNGISAGGDRVTVRRNRLKNVNFGIAMSGEHALVEHNTVENFSGDGMRGLGDYGVFQFNTVKNCYDVNANHDDGFQSWSVGADGKVGTGEVRGIVLRGNRFINYEDPAQPFRGTLQGIGCFDGFFVDWVVENNVVITDHWHGISLYGLRDSRIVNNTVLDLNDTDPGPPWIKVAKHKNGTPSENVVVRNNLAKISNDSGQTLTVDHNLAPTPWASHFVDVARFDVRLLATSAAVNAGAAELAPAEDIEGVSRPQGSAVDLGAHELCDGTCAAGPDAGTPGLDAGAPAPGPDAGEVMGEDAAVAPGAPDAGGLSGPDASGEVVEENGCGCGASGALPPGLLVLALALPASSLSRRRRVDAGHRGHA